jgi:metal-sulfur cluster biosynthetic enzyme
MATEAEIRTALESVVDPEIHLSIIELGLVREVDQTVEPTVVRNAPHDPVLPVRAPDRRRRSKRP